MPVKALRVDAAEVTNTRQSDTDQPVQKLVHAPSAERHAAANLISLAEAKAAHGGPGLGNLWPLPRDLGQLVGSLAHAILVLERLAHAHVDNNLLQARQAELVLAAELLRQPGNNLFLIAIHQPRHGQPQLKSGPFVIPYMTGNGANLVYVFRA